MHLHSAHQVYLNLYCAHYLGHLVRDEQRELIGCTSNKHFAKEVMPGLPKLEGLVQMKSDVRTDRRSSTQFQSQSIINLRI